MSANYGRGYEQGRFDERMDISLGRVDCPGHGQPAPIAIVEPAAEPPGDQAELRDQIVRLIASRLTIRRPIAEIADALLAGPLRSLLDDAARVQRVRELVDECEGQHGQSWNAVFAQRLRRALDEGDRND